MLFIASNLTRNGEAIAPLPSPRTIVPSLFGLEYCVSSPGSSLKLISEGFWVSSRSSKYNYWHSSFLQFAHGRGKFLMKGKVKSISMNTLSNSLRSFLRGNSNIVHKLSQRSHKVLRTTVYLILLLAMLFSGVRTFASQGRESSAALAPAQASVTGGDGKTFQQRRTEWLNSLPAPTSSIDEDTRNEYFFDWLEKGIYNNVVSETIEKFVGTNFWLYGPRAPAAYAAALLLRYGENGTGIISSSDEKAIKNRYENTIETSSMFGHLNPNKELLVMVGVYLYTSYYDSNITVPIYGYPTHLTDPPSYFQAHWKSFSYNGNSYQYGGGPYNALELSRDWLMWRTEGWFARNTSPYGNREFPRVVSARVQRWPQMLLY